MSNSKRTKLVFGHGVNDADYAVQPTVDGKTGHCPYYRAWVNMLQRCYCPKFSIKHHTYAGCTIDPTWLSFMTFRSWMIKQSWEGKHLDKDIAEPNNKHYSPSTCLFVSARVNTLLTDCVSARGLYPVGVSRHHRTNKFHARCRDGSGKQKHLGLHDTEEAAYAAYVTFKSELIREVAAEQSDPRVEAGLIKHAQLLEKPIEQFNIF